MFLPWYAASSQLQTKWDHWLLTETSTAVSLNKPFLRWISQVFVTVMGCWLVHALKFWKMLAVDAIVLESITPKSSRMMLLYRPWSWCCLCGERYRPDQRTYHSCKFGWCGKVVTLVGDPPIGAPVLQLILCGEMSPVWEHISSGSQHTLFFPYAAVRWPGHDFSYLVGMMSLASSYSASPAHDTHVNNQERLLDGVCWTPGICLSWDRHLTKVGCFDDVDDAFTSPVVLWATQWLGH